MQNSLCPAGRGEQTPTPVDFTTSSDTLGHADAPAACIVLEGSGRAVPSVNEDASRRDEQAHRGRKCDPPGSTVLDPSRCSRPAVSTQGAQPFIPRHHEGMTASGKFSNQAGMNFLNELSWQEVDISLASLALLPILEQVKLYQLLIQEGTRHHEGREQRGRRKVILQHRSSHQPPRLADTSVCSASLQETPLRIHTLLGDAWRFPWAVSLVKVTHRPGTNNAQYLRSGTGRGEWS